MHVKKSKQIHEVIEIDITTQKKAQSLYISLINIRTRKLQSNMLQQ